MVGPVGQLTAMTIKRSVFMGGMAVVAATGMLVPVAGPAIAAAATVSVDFTQAIRTLGPANYGATVTGYGSGSYLTNDAVHRGHIDRLGVGTLRFELAYRTPGDVNSGLKCGAEYCDDSVPADAWIAAIRQVGAEPLVILPLDGRHSAEIDRTDAVNIYRHHAGLGAPIRRFILGNELNNPGNVKRMDAGEYSRRFNMIADALLALDGGIRIGGPATAWYDAPYIETVVANAGARISFVDFHRYSQGGTTTYDDATLLGAAVRNFGSDVTALRAQLNRLRPGNQIEILIGEYNLDWDGDPRTLTHLNTLWGAGVVGTALAAGATPVQYGDKNGGLGLTSENGEGGFARNTPLPLYHGIGAFTGQGLFRGFGSTMVRATATNALLHVFASNNDKNVVLVNTATEPMNTSLAFTGLTSGAAEVWQSTNGAPQRTGTVSIAGGSASVTLAARSLTTLVIGGTPPPGNGLTGTYFDNADLTGASVTRVDPTVNFDWAGGAPVAGIGADTFSVRWSGQVQVDQAGTYTFIATTDDGSRLWIDGTQIINAWVDHSRRDDMGQVTLTAGRHDIRFEYYENGWDAVAQLSWSGPGLTRQIIPTGKLWTAAQ